MILKNQNVKFSPCGGFPQIALHMTYTLPLLKTSSTSSPEGVRIFTGWSYLLSFLLPQRSLGSSLPLLFCFLPGTDGTFSLLCFQQALSLKLLLFTISVEYKRALNQNKNLQGITSAQGRGSQFVKALLTEYLCKHSKNWACPPDKQVNFFVCPKINFLVRCYHQIWGQFLDKIKIYNTN